jgi:hypothetical protein
VVAVRHRAENGERRPSPDKAPLDPTAATTSDTPIIAGRGDPRQVGELLAEWVGVRMGEVDALVAEVRAKADSIPDQRVLWGLFGELLLTVRALEHEVAELKRGRR